MNGNFERAGEWIFTKETDYQEQVAYMYMAVENGLVSIQKNQTQKEVFNQRTHCFILTKYKQRSYLTPCVFWFVFLNASKKYKTEMAASVQGNIKTHNSLKWTPFNQD